MTIDIRRTLACLGLSCLACPSPTMAVESQDRSSADDIYRKDAAGREKPDWTHIVWVGPQTYPQPLIWLSHDELGPLDFPERGVVLSALDYRRVERIAVSEYAARPVRSLIDGKVGAFRITQRIGSHKPRTYHLSVAGGCGYIRAILTTKDMNWTPLGRAPFLEYKKICEIVGQPLP